jgi:di- and tripeptidase
MFPMGQASDNAHLDNERMRVENLYKGREVLKRIFARL